MEAVRMGEGSKVGRPGGILNFLIGISTAVSPWSWSAMTQEIKLPAAQWVMDAASESCSTENRAAQKTILKLLVLLKQLICGCYSERHVCSHYIN